MFPCCSINWCKIVIYSPFYLRLENCDIFKYQVFVPAAKEFKRQLDAYSLCHRHVVGNFRLISFY